MGTILLSSTDFEGRGDLRCYEGHKDFIDCTEFKNLLGAKFAPGRTMGDGFAHDVTPTVAAHINDELYAEIFGTDAPTAEALDAWITRETNKLMAMDHTDPQIDIRYAEHMHTEQTLGDGKVGKNDMDYFFHILAQRAGEIDAEPQLTLDFTFHGNKYDHIRADTFATFWDPAFSGAREARALKRLTRKTEEYQYVDTKPDIVRRKPCPPDLSDDLPWHYHHDPAARFSLGQPRSGEGSRVYDHLPSISDGDDGLYTKDFVLPPVDPYIPERGSAPRRTWPLDHLNVEEGSTHRVTPLAYTIDGREIKLYRRDDEGNLTGDALPVPVAQLPDGRMVASIPGYAVLDYDRDGEVESDRFADVVEITWDPRVPDVSTTIQMQTYLGGNTLSAQALDGVDRRDLDGDGSKELIRRETRPQVFANRSVAAEDGQSRNPDGWGAPGPKTTRVTITHGHIGQPTVRD